VNFALTITNLILSVGGGGFLTALPFPYVAVGTSILTIGAGALVFGGFAPSAGMNSVVILMYPISYLPVLSNKGTCCS